MPSEVPLEVPHPRSADSTERLESTHDCDEPDDAEDAALARRAAGGERAAWAAIYDRYADRLHDYCWSILRDRHEAEDTLHDAFVTAAAKIGQLRDPALLRPWLYAICRNHALGRARRRGREVPSEDVAAMTPPGSDGSSAYEVAELRRLVWDAAGGLAPRDRSVLELHLRHGMEGRQLAEALGTNPHHATVLLARVREHVERSLGALLVGRTGRRDCAELDAVLAGWTGELSPLLRKRVARHIDGCAVCGERRRRVVSPLALLSGVPVLPAPGYLRERVLADVAAAAPVPAGGTGPAVGHGPAGAGGHAGRVITRGRVGLVVCAAGLTLLALFGAVLVSAGNEHATGPTGASTVDGAARGRTPTDATVAEPSGGTPLGTGDGGTGSTTGAAGTGGEGGTGGDGGAHPAPAALELLTPSLDLATTATEGALRFRNSGGRPLPWAVTSDDPVLTMHPAAGVLPPGETAAIMIRLDRGALAEGPFAARLRLAAARGVDVPISAVQERAPVIGDLSATSAWLVPSSTCDRSRATATVADDGAVAVTLHWGRTGGLLTVTPMAGSGGHYAAMVGPVLASGAGDVRWWVSAMDARGNTSRSPEELLPVRAAGHACP